MRENEVPDSRTAWTRQGRPRVLTARVSEASTAHTSDPAWGQKRPQPRVPSQRSSREPAWGCRARPEAGGKASGSGFPASPVSLPTFKAAVWVWKRKECGESHADLGTAGIQHSRVRERKLPFHGGDSGQALPRGLEAQSGLAPTAFQSGRKRGTLTLSLLDPRACATSWKATPGETPSRQTQDNGCCFWRS